MSCCIITDSSQYSYKVTFMTTTATTTSKSLTNDEIKLLSDFTNTVNARIINTGNEIQKLHLSYDKETGYTIDLVEAPKEEVE